MIFPSHASVAHLGPDHFFPGDLFLIPEGVWFIEAGATKEYCMGYARSDAMYPNSAARIADAGDLVLVIEDDDGLIMTVINGRLCCTSITSLRMLTRMS